MNRFVTFSLASMMALSVISCGGKKNKKPTVEREGNTISDKPASTKQLSSQEALQKEIERRLDFEGAAAPQVFTASKNDHGTLQLIFLPANPKSPNHMDHQDLWFYNLKNEDDEGINAYAIYKSEKEKDLKNFNFSLVEYDQDIKSIIEQEQGNNIKFINENEIIVTCGKHQETFERNKITSADSMKFLLLSKENEDFFKSPCSTYVDSEELLSSESEETPEQETTQDPVIATADDAPVNDSNEQEDIDQDNQCSLPDSYYDNPPNTEATEQTVHHHETYHQNTNRLHIKIKVRCFHAHGNKSEECKVIEHEASPLVEEHNDHEFFTHVHSNSCKSVKAKAFGTSRLIQTESTELTSSERKHDIENINLSDSLLPFCKSHDQRIFLNQKENIEERKEEIAVIESYCKAHPESNEFCRADEIHKAHKKIEASRKKMAKVLHRCHEKKQKDIAKGQFSDPEMNTCGIFRRTILTSRRRRLQKTHNKLNDLIAKCQVNASECSSKKENRYKTLIEERQAGVEKLEARCHTNL